jgi:two-component system chemotaxis sensor kinase CheA
VPRRRPPRHSSRRRLRVSVEKVDQLINLVGELVITQAMLAQNSKQIDTALYQQLAAGLADLDRNTRDLQESVMSIRMIRCRWCSRASRACCATRRQARQEGRVRHAGRGDRARQGPGREDHRPADHLVRNSCDHGIERRPSAGQGQARARHDHARGSHQGGSIADRGARRRQGLSRES